MSRYGGPSFRPDQSYTHGYGPGGPGLRHHGRLDEKAPGVFGESAAYDMLPEHNDSQTLYDYRTGGHGRPQSHSYAPSHARPQGYRPEYGAGRADDRQADRGIADFFYKKPDPMYMGPYDEYHQPQLSKSKVAMTVAALAAMAISISRHKKKKAAEKCADSQCEDGTRGPRKAHHHSSHHHHHHSSHHGTARRRRSYTEF